MECGRKGEQSQKKLSGQQDSGKNFLDKARESRHWQIRNKSALKRHVKIFIIRKVFGLSRKFVDCPNNFWIIHTVSGLSEQLLDYLHSFWIVWNISGLFREFLDCRDSFLVIWTVSSLFQDRYELKGALFILLQKLFEFLQKISEKLCWWGFSDSGGGWVGCGPRLRQRRRRRESSQSALTRPYHHHPQHKLRSTKIEEKLNPTNKKKYGRFSTDFQICFQFKLHLHLKVNFVFNSDWKWLFRRLKKNSLERN